jgi:hypothetical protein
MALPCAILWPDTHFPFEHKRAVKLVLKVADFFGSRLKEIVFLGDLADFYYISAHGPRHPSMVGHLKDEVDSVNAFLDLIDKRYPRTKKTYIEGNHEWRLERYVQNRAPELFGLVDWKELFCLHKRGYKLVPWSGDQKTRIMGSSLWARHRPLASSPKASAAKALCNLAYGDIHRIEESHAVGLDGSNYVNFSVGWLGDKRYKAPFGFVQNQHQWQLGFGVVYVCPKTKLFYHHKIHILEVGGKLSCTVEGKRFEG